MQHCRKALEEGVSVLNACTESGFPDYSSFLKTFRRLYDITPCTTSLPPNTVHRTGQRCVNNRFMRSSPFSFCKSIQRFFFQTAKISTFSKVRICEAKHSNESYSGAIKRLTGACASNLHACFMTYL